MAKAPSKAVSSQMDLGNIVKLHSEINQLNSDLKIKKDEFSEATDALKAESKSVFDHDLGYIGDDSVPEVFGNHEYFVGDQLITVNYKLSAGGLTFKQIGGRPAKEVLIEFMGEKEYGKLFTETKTIVNDRKDLMKVHEFRPDLVGVKLNTSKLSNEVLDELFESHPDAFEPYVRDEAGFLEIPMAKVETEVSTANGFIEKVSSLPHEVQFNLRDFIRKVLASCVTSAVKCGNKSDS